MNAPNGGPVPRKSWPWCRLRRRNWVELGKRIGSVGWGSPRLFP